MPAIFVFLFLFVLPVAATSQPLAQPAIYQTPAELKKLATPYTGKQWPLARVTDEDRLVFADVVASERAVALKRTKQQEDYEFGLASACFPIPNWPKPPPPNPPVKPQADIKGIGRLIATPSGSVAQTTGAELLYQRLQAVMEGISTNEAQRQELRRILKRDVLVLGSAALRERKLLVTDVFMF